MYPNKDKIQVFNYSNGDIEYLTPLPEVLIKAYRSDFELGKNANYETFREWFLDRQRKEAVIKAKYARAGIAPLTTPVEDTKFIHGEELKNIQRNFGDTISNRHSNGLYDKYPFLLDTDSMVYKRMNYPLSGYSCINSNTTNYGERFADMRNWHFEQNHFGFTPVSLDSLKSGDILQLRRPWRDGAEANRSFHAVTFDSYNDNGDALAWDQHGAVGLITPEMKSYLISSPDDGQTPRVKNAFRFTGDKITEEEIRKAFEEYQKRNNPLE